MDSEKSATERRIRILCVDDDWLVARSLRSVIENESDMDCVGTLGRADSLDEALDQTPTDVVLLDLSMPGKDPITALKEVSSSHPETRVIVFTGHSEQERVDRAVGAGAWGYVSKSQPTDRLVQAIRGVIQGEFVLSI
jgi:DNA-binding NarL/FixJ family response regulator